MKKIFIFIFLSCFFINVYSEGYKIENIEYDTKGMTRETALMSNVPIDTTTVFKTEDELNKYLKDLDNRLNNLRILESASVEIVSKEDKNEYISVSILIKTKDTWNIIVIPYPSYDSNSGFSLKLKIKDYNFLGTMDVFDGTVNYKVSNSNQQDIKFSFDVPFPTFEFLSMQSTFGADFSIAYTFGDKSPSLSFGQSLDFLKQLNETISFYLGLSNKFYLEPDYEQYGDNFYLKDSISLAFPIKLAKIDNVGTLTWKPNISFNLNWDFDVFNGFDNFGITKSSLFGPSISFEHSVSVGRVNWHKNFRKGFDISIAQTLDYNLDAKSINPYFSLNSKIYTTFSDWCGLNSSQYLYINAAGKTETLGEELRGIKNDLFTSDSAIVINIDLPIKVVQTDWVNFFNYFGLNWNWTRLFDFELQLSPFFDMSLCKNVKTGTQYLIEDGFYSCGLEMLVFPNKMKSIVGRVSLGVDAVKTLDKIGNKISFVDKVTNRVFNTEWRSGSMWELFIGIGLFY